MPIHNDEEAATSIDGFKKELQLNELCLQVMKGATEQKVSLLDRFALSAFGEIVRRELAEGKRISECDEMEDVYNVAGAMIAHRSTFLDAMKGGLDTENKKRFN